MKDNRPIGVFDSGVGGLTVLHALRQTLPHENFVYLGDTARVPYGPKSATLVQRFALEAVSYLLTHDIKLLVIACNTVVSANAIAQLNTKFPHLPIIGVVEPGAQAATEVSIQKSIGVLATRGTLQSGSYPRAIKSYAPNAEVFIYAAPLLVPLAEEGWHNDEITRNIISHYLKNILQHPIDCVLLGCTHYPLFIPMFKQLLPSHIALVDSATTTAQATQQFLQTHALQNEQQQEGLIRFFVTDDPEQFTRVGSVFLGHSIVPEKVTLVDL